MNIEAQTDIYNLLHAERKQGRKSLCTVMVTDNKASIYITDTVKTLFQGVLLNYPYAVLL